MLLFCYYYSPSVSKRAHGGQWREAFEWRLGLQVHIRVPWGLSPTSPGSLFGSLFTLLLMNLWAGLWGHVGVAHMESKIEKGHSPELSVVDSPQPMTPPHP